MAYNTKSTYNLSTAAQTIIKDGTALAPSLAKGTLVIYDGKQPPTADTALTSDNNVLATLALPASPLGIYGPTSIVVLDPLPHVPYSRAGTATFARVKTAANAVMFDCSVDIESGEADLYIDQNPVRLGDACRVGNNTPQQVSGRSKVNIGDRE